MSNAFDDVKNYLLAEPKKWLITGVAGFIGSNLLEHLLQLDQYVIGLDNFSTGKIENLAEVRSLVTDVQWSRFQFIEGDIREPAICSKACSGVDFVLHQAALGSVPRSIANPASTNENNITGTLNMLIAARDSGVRRFVFASSSSVYGDHPALPKNESVIGNQLSPYAVSKFANELYAEQFAVHYGLQFIGLRYFNVFGPRQDADGPYAAVIPKWISALIRNQPVRINGTGETSRDFCYVENVVQMNLLAAATFKADAVNQIYNVALNARTTLNELYAMLKDMLVLKFPHLVDHQPIRGDFRPGDVMHSQAEIYKAVNLIGYSPRYSIKSGLEKALHWYVASAS